MDVAAHSLSNRPESEWEPLSVHLREVADAAASRAGRFGWGPAGTVLGLLHDIGKVSAEYQDHIRGRPGLVDHSTAGAREARRLHPQVGRLLAAAIAGHHAGLSDGEALRRRLDPAQTPVPDFSRWASVLPRHALPSLAGCRPPKPSAHRAFEAAFLVRMLFSCLVDADFVATEAFYARAKSEPVERGGFLPIHALEQRLSAHLERSFAVPRSELDALRTRIRIHAVAKSDLAPGLFTLTVPTGGGKTLTSLAFALRHAVRHGLDRVVIVAPFQSIIEQTADTVRGALGTDRDVLEHHASFDWDAAERRAAAAADSGEGADGLAKLQRAAENWDAPIVVTTSVQFFESLFANRTSRCRKLHNLARAVIVLDEAQTLPLPLLLPCIAAIDELARNYGSSVVLCTATQPALRRDQDGFADGLAIPDSRELAPDPPALYAALRRTRLERLPGRTDDGTIASRFAAVDRMLCIVNSRRHARELYGHIAELPGARHLSTLMCPRHRRAVLAAIRNDLRDRRPVRLVATSLIEAGVDISFPEVWRALAGLDQITQAAGRCNREGETPGLGRVVVFKPEQAEGPGSMRLAQGEAERVLTRFAAEPGSLEAVRAYFRQMYWAKDRAGLDAARLDGNAFPILQKLGEHAITLEFPFESVARAFRMIDEAMDPVVVPWDAAAVAVLARLRIAVRPSPADLRLLQQFVVPLPAKARGDWLALGVLQPVNPALGNDLLAFANLAHYGDQTGVRLDDPTHRSAENNFA